MLRENFEEVISRWLDGCEGRIAEEFEQLLRTPMGHSFGASMYKLALRYLEAEEYETDGILREIRSCASDASFRRAAVGFGLPDIIRTATAFREAMQQTLLNHYCSGDSDGEALLECFALLTSLGDAMVEGEVAGFFVFSKFGDDDEEMAEAV
ncbi:MAG: hypothetical protein C4534_04210 [Gaiellales bacterium]|nr:MAG: hypothetical protein C4534_04210 [Gaiellales bacterium]